MTRREPVQKRSRERVEAILRSAGELLAQGGVEALTTRSLASFSGIPVWFGTRLNVAVHDSVRELDARMAARLHAATRSAGFIEEGPHFGAGLIVRLWDRTFEHIFRIERTRAEQQAIVEEVIDMIASYTERFATPRGLEGSQARSCWRSTGRRRRSRRPRCGSPGPSLRSAAGRERRSGASLTWWRVQGAAAA